MNANEKALTDNEGVHLQGIGRHLAKVATAIEVDDVLVWNYGHTSAVVAVRDVSPQYREVDALCDDGKVYTRRIKKSRLMAWSPKLTAARS